MYIAELTDYLALEWNLRFAERDWMGLADTEADDCDDDVATVH